MPVQAIPERLSVCNALGPMMLCIQIAKQFAPFKYARIYEVAVERNPELLATPSNSRSTPSAVVRRIPQEVHA